MPTPVLDNRQLGPDTARLNLLTNGGFEIWQRGAGPFSGSPVYSADRWLTYSLSVTRDTANVDTGSVACAAVVCSSTAGGPAFYQIVKESQVGGRTWSMSIRVKTNVANAVRLGIVTDGTSAPPISYSSYHTGSGTYQTLTAAGYVAPADATYVQVTMYFAATCTAYLDNAMLVVGSQAADYAPLHPADDLARCRRYYEFIVIPSTGYAGMGFAYAATNMVAPLPFTFKAITPTVTLSAASSWMTGNNTGGSLNATAVSPGQIGQQTANLAMTVASGLSLGQAAPFQAQTGAGSTIAIEANP